MGKIEKMNGFLSREIQDVKAELARKRAEAVITIYDEVRRRGGVVVPTENNTGNRAADLMENDDPLVVRILVPERNIASFDEKASVVVDKLEVEKSDQSGDFVYIRGFITDGDAGEEVCVEINEAEIDAPEDILDYLAKSAPLAS